MNGYIAINLDAIKLMAGNKYLGKYRSESNRKKGWDYTLSGCYSITLCTRYREEYFGKVKNGIMNLSKIGKIIDKEIKRINKIRRNVDIDIFQIMPDHIHILFILNNDNLNENYLDRESGFAINRESTTNRTGGITGKHNPMLRTNSLSYIIRSFKGKCTYLIRKINLDFQRQSNYYDKIIKTKEHYYKSKNYIRNNPKNRGNKKIDWN